LFIRPSIIHNTHNTHKDAESDGPTAEERKPGPEVDALQVWVGGWVGGWVGVMIGVESASGCAAARSVGLLSTLRLHPTTTRKHLLLPLPFPLIAINHPPNHQPRNHPSTTNHPPTRVLPTGSDDGLVEFVPSVPLSRLLAEHRSIHRFLLASGQGDPSGGRRCRGSWLGAGLQVGLNVGLTGNGVDV